MIFAVNGIGDSLLAVPMLRALQSIFGARLIILYNDYGETPFFADLTKARLIPVQTSFQYDGHNFDAENLASIIGGCDLFINTTTYFSRSLRSLKELLNPDIYIAFYEDATYRLSYSKGDHEIQRLFTVVQKFNPLLKVSAFTEPPNYSNPAKESAAQIRERLAGQSPLLTIHPVSTPDKSLPTHLLHHLLETLKKDHRDWYIAILSPNAKPSLIAENSANLCQLSHLPLDVACALVANSNAFIGIDSVFLHVADFARIPAVGIFGPTDFRQWGLHLTSGSHVVEATGDLGRLSPSRLVSSASSLIAQSG